MIRSSRPGIACLSLLSTVAILGCQAAARRVESVQVRLGTGEEWKSWTPKERQLFVEGFLVGNARGQYELCENLDQNAEVLKLRAPASSCDQLRVSYSHTTMGDSETYTHAYVSVLDDFYKHPECQVMPYTSLLEDLDDDEYTSGEELFKRVQSGRAHLGFFSGFDGMEKCYGVKQWNKLPSR